MDDKIFCPKCHKGNDIHKFCVYCGHKILDDEQLKLMKNIPEPYCLNCGRPVKKGQSKCECGYEFKAINCPKCNSKNSYTNRFCTKCGKRLWTYDVCEITYDKLNYSKYSDNFPHALRSTMLYTRYKVMLTYEFQHDFNALGDSVEELQSNLSKIDNNVYEILSRWKIVSPNYCINCFSIMKPNQYECNCGTVLSDGEERVDYLKNKTYTLPTFNIPGIRWTFKFSEYYLDSLAPDIGESQLEYRERLKWEFSEHNEDLKISIRKEIKRKKEIEEEKRRRKERRAWEKEYIRRYGGGYCFSDCTYHYDEYVDESGGLGADYSAGCIVEHYCSLGHSVSYGSFCKDYK